MLLGGVLLTFSEIVMWQNPPAYTALDWLIRILLYVCIASLILDFTSRFQARDLPGIVLIGGLYGLLATAFISRDIYVNLPWYLLLRGMGLQTGAGIYGLVFFVLVLQGRPIDWRALVGAGAVGALWGIWIKWYPIQPQINWTPVTIESATIYFLIAAAILGVMFIFIAPRFGIVKEQSFELEWYEAILIGIPPFFSLLIGLFDEVRIPAFGFFQVAGVISVVMVALILNRRQGEVSYLANLTFIAPNPQTFIFLAITFLIAGTVSSLWVTEVDSPIGNAAYWIVLIASWIWLPASVSWIGVRAYRSGD
jgi:hypothetical protein